MLVREIRFNGSRDVRGIEKNTLDRYCSSCRDAVYYLGTFTKGMAIVPSCFFLNSKCTNIFRAFGVFISSTKSYETSL